MNVSPILDHALKGLRVQYEKDKDELLKLENRTDIEKFWDITKNRDKKIESRKEELRSSIEFHDEHYGFGVESKAKPESKSNDLSPTLSQGMDNSSSEEEDRRKEEEKKKREEIERADPAKEMERLQEEQRLAAEEQSWKKRLGKGLSNDDYDIGI